MVEKDRCPICGSQQRASLPGGLCPRCLLTIGLSADEDDRNADGREEAEAAGFNEDGAIPPGPPALDLGDRYEILGEIARGGMGIIVWARDPAFDRDVAIKVLHERYRDQPEMAGRFVEEARIASRLQHPGIVPIFERGTLADGRPYYAMKLVQGRNLAEILAERPDLAHDRDRLLDIFLKVVQTAAYAHSHGIIHRDLTPANVMVGEYGEVQVMDWGLAKILARDESRAGEAEADSSLDGPRLTFASMGTPGYMAPEQVAGGPLQRDERVDVFGLGSMLCKILTGRPAYHGDTPREMYDKARRADLSETLSRLGSCGADEELIGLARDCLATDRELRPRNAGEVAERLSAYLDGVRERLRLAELARVEAQARAAEERKRRRLTALLAALVVALVALAVVSYAGWLERRQSRQSAAALVFREVEVLRNEAVADPTGDPAQWRGAHDAVRRAGLLLADAPEVTRERLKALTTEVERGFHQAEADRRLLDRLEVARYRADEGDLAVADDQFEAAFREAGLDVGASDSAAIGVALAARPKEVKDAIIATLDCWTIVRREREAKGHKDIASWRATLAAARAADPDPWRNSLRDALEAKDHQALARLARSNIDGRPAPSLWLMGRLLIWSGQIVLADEFLARAWRIYPHDFWINLDLSLALMLNPWRPDLALNYATSAVTLRPESAVAHLRLGWIHQVFANKVDSEAEYRTALRLWPDYGRAHARLAGLLFFRSRRVESAEEYRAAIRLMPDEAEPYWVGLGDSLMRLHRLEEAAVELDEAARRYPSSIRVWIQIARLRIAQRDPPKAAEALQRAERLAKPGSPEAAAIAKERQRVELVRRLPALLRGVDHFRDNTERLELAKLCGEAGQAAAGARLYAEAIAADPTIVEDRVIRPRCYGAFLAACAGCERTRDDPPPNEAERARLRRQALDWLRGEMVTWIPMLEGGPSGNRRDAAAALRGWMNTHELAGVRDPKALEALPEDERKAWQALWDEAAVRILVDPG